MSPAFIAVYSMRGMLYAKNEQYSKAVIDYSKVIEKSAEADILPYHSISAYHNRALCYFELKDYHPALDDCNVVLEIDHNNSEAIALRKKILDIVAPPPPPPPPSPNISVPLGILSVIFPIVGWVLWGIWHTETPTRARQAAICGWVGFTIGLIINVFI